MFEIKSSTFSFKTDITGFIYKVVACFKVLSLNLIKNAKIIKFEDKLVTIQHTFFNLIQKVKYDVYLLKSEVSKTDE